LVASDEDCDDGNPNGSDGCSHVCTIEHGFDCTGEPSVCTSNCGDGLVAANEGCDDGNSANDDGCSDGCTVEPGWSCTGEPSVCTPNSGGGGAGGAAGGPSGAGGAGGGFGGNVNTTGGGGGAEPAGGQAGANDGGNTAPTASSTDDNADRGGCKIARDTSRSAAVWLLLGMLAIFGYWRRYNYQQTG